VPSITVELTDTQLKGLEYAAVSPQDWADNALTNRARIANDEIVQTAMNYYLDNGIQAPITREAIVADAFTRGIVKTAAVRQAEAEAEQAAMMAAQQESS
jgi:hypothetical protein